MSYIIFEICNHFSSFYATIKLFSRKFFNLNIRINKYIKIPKNAGTLCPVSLPKLDGSLSFRGTGQRVLQ